MLDRHSGKIIHIDFGDCFEVAMKRDKFPEKIPFRLTRMLINAMACSVAICFEISSRVAGGEWNRGYLPPHLRGGDGGSARSCRG